MHPKQRKLLEPLADAIAELDKLSTPKLRRVLAACDAASGTDCWWATFAAAAVAKVRVTAELDRREKVRGLRRLARRTSVSK